MEHLLGACLRKLLRGTDNSSTAKKNSLSVIKNIKEGLICSALGKRRSSRGRPLIFQVEKPTKRKHGL